jgi:hypothetical protein
MKRIGAIVLFAGAVLVSTHILAPAEPPANRASELAAGRAALAQVAAASAQVAQVDGEVDRLRKRLSAQPPFPPPTRDPFTYGVKAEPRRPATSVPAAPATPVPEVPRVVLPQLIAIMTGAPARTAVLGIGDHVQIVKVGEAFSAFVVRSIDIDGVSLVESATGRTIALSLR